MQYLNGAGLHSLFESGYRNLKKNTDAINDLNVFPVPDGDTGTNMVRTFGGGLQSVSSQEENVGAYMQALSQAVLMSARGNSGVIFSQFVSGMARGFAGCAQVDFQDFVRAFANKDSLLLTQVLVPMEKWKRDALAEILAQWLELLESALTSRAGMTAVSTHGRELARNRSAVEIYEAAQVLKKALVYTQSNVSPAAVCGWLAWTLR